MHVNLHLPHRHSARSESLGSRARAWCGQFDLDRQLAGGADPTRSPGLQARAHQLTSAHFRRELVAQLDGALAKAEHPPHWHSASLRVQTHQVRAAREALQTLRQALQSPSCRVQGAALAACLLNDPNGPLYRPGPDHTITDLANRATAALTAAAEPPPAG